jgi:hypothetical protein
LHLKHEQHFIGYVHTARVGTAGTLYTRIREVMASNLSRDNNQPTDQLFNYMCDFKWVPKLARALVSSYRNESMVPTPSDKTSPFGFHPTFATPHFLTEIDIILCNRNYIKVHDQLTRNYFTHVSGAYGKDRKYA